jgi:hypothetical protein
LRTTLKLLRGKLRALQRRTAECELGSPGSAVARGAYMGNVRDSEAYVEALRKMTDSDVAKFYLLAANVPDDEQTALCRAELRRRRLVN